MQRVCFTLRVKPELIDEYVARHEQVWPEMLAAIADSGRRNYSLFLAEDGLLVGYYETDDDDASRRALAEDPRTEQWEREAAQYFEELPGKRPDQAATQLREVFNLEAQLTSD
ncbi:MAG: L-rhamnose mutarotase [Actinobacteria bacterium HGW-Actinobacteria-4]|nr:MAG: L-rhamnose mutarotase [Actinobacteria bacterium HGW-Actinobacteria-4]